MSINDFAKMTILLSLICFSIYAKFNLPAFLKQWQMTLLIPYRSTILSKSHIISEVNGFLRFTEKFQIATKNDRKTNFAKKCQTTQWAKNFVKIPLSHNFPRKMHFLHFMQNFKIKSKLAGKCFGKNCQMTPSIP